ncbi:MAG: hypothetical protein JXA15_09395 [Spirochaetales bacterium]|nr:hypothetical protein [Spirochaetales bacterium]
MIDSVIVHRGREFPSYISDFVDQFYLFNQGNRLWIVTDARFPELDELCRRHPDCRSVSAAELEPTRHHRFFSRWNLMNSTFRGGFWRFAVERFFVLGDLMAAKDLGPVLHFEYDNMVYFDVAKLEAVLGDTSKGISLPADSTVRCIPSVVYIDGAAALADFCRTYNLRYLLRRMNDMNAFSRYARDRKDRCSFLPVVPAWYKEGRDELRSRSGLATKDLGLLDRDFESFGGVFDAAAFGQYLGGVDPRNDAALGPGFVNETAMYSAAEMPVRWERDDANRLVPIAEYGGRFFPIHNLHIHSKALHAFRSDRSVGGT